MQLSPNVGEVLKNIVADYTVSSNISAHKAKADDHLASYGMWNNKASISSASMESSSLFGAAGAEAYLGLTETGAISGEMGALENSVFNMLAIATQGFESVTTGMYETIARQKSEGNPIYKKMANDNARRNKEIGDVVNMINNKIDVMLEMKSNLSVLLDQQTLLFNGLINAADNNRILSLQTADTRCSSTQEDKKLVNYEKMPSKPVEIKNDADKKAEEKESKTNKNDSDSNKYSSSESSTNKANNTSNNSQSYINTPAQFSFVGPAASTPSFSAPAPALKSFSAIV